MGHNLPQFDLSLTTQLSLTICEQIDRWLLRYPPEQKCSGVLQALHIVQREQGGWLTLALLNAVADYLNMERSRVYEIATFYSLYRLHPVGKHVIAVCRNISCMLNGADEIFIHLQERLNVRCDQTTADHQFTLCEAECLGACIKAPVCQINQQYYENLTPQKMDEILDKLNKKDQTHGQ